MNIKQLQNIPNTFLGKALNSVTLFDGRSLTTPLVVSVILTYGCNLNCEFCYQDKTKNKSFKDFTLKDVETIEKNIAGSFALKPRIHLFGGEPTVNKDFLKIVELFSEKGYRISMTTNGVDIDKYVDTLARLKGLKEINLSLNTMDFERTSRTLDIFRSHGNNERISINLNCPVTVANQAELFEIAKRFQNSYVDVINFQHTTFTGDPNDKLNAEVIEDQIIQIKKAGFETPVLFMPDIKLRDIAPYYNDRNFPYGTKSCVFPWFVLFIQPNGDVIPCDEVNLVMGNALRDNLSSVWNGAKYTNFRNDITKIGVSQPICQRCCHRRYY